MGAGGWRMDSTRKLNLENLVPLWERKVSDLVHKSVVESFSRVDVDITNPSGAQFVVRQGSPLAQDVFRTLILSQRSFKR